MPTAVDWSKLSDEERVHEFRLHQFLKMGFWPDQAEVLAHSDVSWHEALAIIDAGCPHDVAVRILL